MNKPPRPQAVIFDWDNTLVDTWGVIHAALNHTFEAFDLESWTLDETRARVRKSMRDSFPAIFGADRWEAAGETFYAYFKSHHLAGLSPKPGAEDLLKALADSKIPAAVVSNKTGDILRKESTHLGWDGYFRRLVGAGDANNDKPDSAPVALALDALGTTAGSHVWFAGDADIDLECACRAGCLPVLVRDTAPAKMEMIDFPPEIHFSGCSDFCSLVIGG
ncbi:MAG: HAD family hydrolase [Magnetovibrionaceae bacterium]